MARRHYWVEWKLAATGKWVRLTGAAGQRGYVLGWYHALTSILPRRAYRMVASDGEIPEEDEERGAPQPQGLKSRVKKTDFTS